MKRPKFAASDAYEESVQEIPAWWKTLAYPTRPSTWGSEKKSADGVTSRTSAPFTFRGSLTSTFVDSLASSSSVSSVSARARSGIPRLFPIVWTLPMISLEYFCPIPMESMISRAAMDISAVSIPYGQKTEHRRHWEH